jgi:N-acetylmuramoyl-L-alanine amidase
MKKFKIIKTLIMSATIALSISNVAFAANYKVKSGDSLYTIGKLFNTTSNELMASNKLKSSLIYPGQTLKVSCATHTVVKGDTLYLIAKKYGISLNSLREANNKWGNYIYPGDVLNLPGIKPTTESITPKPVISYTQAELDILARLITAESQDQPYDAQVGVGAVVVSRVKSSTFPNTITSVIYQKDDKYYQFTPVENGWINKPATATAVKAAKDAINGIDPSNGALYYFDKSATNKWLWSKPIRARIGDMIFVY